MTGQKGIVAKHTNHTASQEEIMLLSTTCSLALEWELLQVVICATFNSFLLCFNSSYRTKYNTWSFLKEVITNLDVWLTHYLTISSHYADTLLPVWVHSLFFS